MKNNSNITKFSDCVIQIYCVALPTEICTKRIDCTFYKRLTKKIITKKKLKTPNFMKKIVFILSAIVLASCSKSKTDEAVVTPEVAKNVMEMKIPELNFYGKSNKNALNIQVGDLVEVKLEITKLTGAEVIVATPVAKSSISHELFNTDYELYTKSTIDNSNYVKVEFLNLKKGENVFFIKPLVPGTFDIKLEDKTKVYTFTGAVNFSAVKITTTYRGGIDGNCGFSRWRHQDYYFTIDSGNQTFDKFFRDETASFMYSTSYDGESKSGNFAPNTELQIINTRNECGDYPGVPNNISSISITKTVGDQKTISTYYNIPI
jgi:hypothetical protein